MDTIKEYKKELTEAYKALPEAKRADMLVYYSLHSDDGVIRTIIAEAKNDAESIMDYADRQGYGYGEVHYNLNERVDSFAEELPELKKQYKRLQQAYFNFVTEAKNI